MQWERISIIGAGLLGGSLGLAIRKRKLAARVHAFVRRSAGVTQCQSMGVADFATQDIEKAVQHADLVVLCTPLSQMGELAARMREHLKPGVIVTDVGSVKGAVVRELDPLIRRAQGVFVGSHPMAGSEKTGLAAAHSELFENWLPAGPHDPGGA
jgi:prephenate dehydrogenase